MNILNTVIKSDEEFSRKMRSIPAFSFGLDGFEMNETIHMPTPDPFSPEQMEIIALVKTNPKDALKWAIDREDNRLMLYLIFNNRKSYRKEYYKLANAYLRQSPAKRPAFIEFLIQRLFTI